MKRKEVIERIISIERLEPYLRRQENNLDKAILHYKSNISISEAFYPLLAILEIGVRNCMDDQLSKRFEDKYWFENFEFIKIASRFQIDQIAMARSNILSQKKAITSGKVIAELSFGFWTSLLDTKFEMTLWKSLRLSFRNCPKQIRKRKTMSAKFNGIRKLRNRIFHHEAITWDLHVLDSYKNEILEGIEWLDIGMLEWVGELNHVDTIIENNKRNIY